VDERNAERVLARALAEIGAELGLRVESLGGGWIFRLSRGGVVRHVHGYAFDLNSAATHAIACDKSATAEVLAGSGVAHVEHRLFLHTLMASYVPHAGNWRGMLAYCEANGFDVVAKDNAGTGGRGVYRVRDALGLERAAGRILERSTALALSPYHAAGAEHRFVVLGGECVLAYTKVRPGVTGDGRRTVLRLLIDGATDGSAAALLLASMDPEDVAGLGEVLPTGVTRLLNWRHNLGQGASVLPFDPGAEHADAARLALRAASALNLAFGSVDVIETRAGPLVLEANSGVMMEFLARSTPGGYDLVKGVYRRAVGMMFAR